MEFTCDGGLAWPVRENNLGDSTSHHHIHNITRNRPQLYNSRQHSFRTTLRCSNGLTIMSQPQTSTRAIPSFYCVFFTIIDPIICLWGAYMDFFDPRMVLSSHLLADTPDIGHIMILQQRGGGLLNFGFISAVLLRYTQDIKIWHILEIGLLVTDFAYFPAAFGALREQGRVLPETWRAEDWGTFVVMSIVTLVRLAFLARVGFADEDEGVKEKKKQ